MSVYNLRILKETLWIHCQIGGETQPRNALTHKGRLKGETNWDGKYSLGDIRGES